MSRVGSYGWIVIKQSQNQIAGTLGGVKPL